MRTKVKEDINFLPKRIVLARKRRKKSFLHILTGILVLVIMGFATWLPFHIISYYEDKLIGINMDIDKLEPAKPYYEEKKALQQDLEHKELALRDIKAKQEYISEILNQINSILPPKCYITALIVKTKEEFSMQVLTNSPVETARVMVGLRQLELFQKVELAGLGEIPFTAEPQTVEFKLKFKEANNKKEEEKVNSEPVKNETIEEGLQKARTMIEQQ